MKVDIEVEVEVVIIITCNHQVEEEAADIINLQVEAVEEATTTNQRIEVAFSNLNLKLISNFHLKSLPIVYLKKDLIKIHMT